MENLFDLYFRYTKETESPIIFHRWSLLTALGAFIGRNAWLPFGANRIFPNMYVMLIGNPGSRKSVAIRGVRRVLATTGYNTFAAEKTTKEKFLLDLQGDLSGNDQDKQVINLFGGGSVNGGSKEIFVTADEFNEFAGSGNIEFLSMLGALWDWDDEQAPYKSRTKNSKSVEIFQPTISILAGNTYSGFAEAFPLNILGQGFMSRLVLIHSEPSGKKITIPLIPSAELLGELTAEFANIRGHCSGEFTLSRPAYSALDSIYKTWPELEDTRFKHYSTRRFTHLLKVCIICTAIRKKMEIEIADVLLANTILTFAEQSMPKAMGELGRKKSSDVSSTIMSMLYEATRPITLMEMWRLVEKDLEHLSDLTRIVQNLQSADKIQIVKINGIQGFLPKQRALSKNHMYVDMALLKGAEIK